MFVHVSVLMFIKREKIKYSERERGIEKINKGLFPKKKSKGRVHLFYLGTLDMFFALSWLLRKVEPETKANMQVIYSGTLYSEKAILRNKGKQIRCIFRFFEIALYPSCLRDQSYQHPKIL